MFITIFLIDGLLILGLLWIVIRFLYKYREYIASTIATQGLSRFVRLIMVAPPLIIVIIAIVFGLVLHNELLLRFAHATFLLSMWTSVTILGLTFLILMRIRSPYLFVAFLGILCAFIAILSFTSISNFQAAFAQAGSTGYLLLLIEGLVIIVLCYPILFRLNQVLQT
jgi:hypothetical protein